MEKLPIDKLLPAYLVIAKFVNQTIETLRDGKFHPREAILFIDELMLIPEVVENWPAIVAQFNNVDPVENIEISEALQNELHIDNERTEMLIVKLNNIIILINSLVQEFIVPGKAAVN